VKLCLQTRSWRWQIGFVQKGKLPHFRSMKKIFYLLLFYSVIASAQDKKIKLVERGLLPLTQVTGQPFTHYSITERLQFYNIPSVSIAVVDHGRLAWARAYGWADRATHRRATSQTLYQAASLSKTANAVLVLHLVRQGRLSLDTDIRHYLRTWIFPDNDSSKGKKVTLRDLLSHTAGIGVPGFKGYDKGKPVPTLGQILDGRFPANNEAVRPVVPPGKMVQYSGGGIVIIQKILQDQMKEDYAALIEQQLLVPLQLLHSTYAMPLPALLAQHAASGYDKDEKEIAGKYKIYPELAPAGLWTTPLDFAHLLMTVQRQYSREGMTTPVLDNSALGGFIYHMGDADYFAHTGHNAGFNAVYYYDMAKGNGVVIIVNSDNNAILPEILKSVADVYNWHNVYQPLMKHSVSVPDSLLKNYTGMYYCAKLKRAVHIRQGRKGLEMFQELECKKGTGCFEPVYFSAPDTCFVLSSGLNWSFSDQGQKLLIHDGDDVYTAVKN